MKKTELPKKIPAEPGVYFFLGKRREILYIGKATSLSSRIRSYFVPDLEEKRNRLISDMRDAAKKIEWTVTDSVLEAMLLEVNLIRTHKPRYNTISKDDKSFNHLVITNETYPRVLVVRGKDITEKFTEKKLTDVFGPFPSAMLFKDALRIMRKLFKFYDTKKPVEEARSRLERGRIDFNRQIGLYPNVQSKEEYLKTIRHIRLFFKGKKKQVIKELEREMMAHAKKEEFEKANEIKRKIFALTHIQDVALIRDDTKVYRDQNRIRIEAYDISHTGGSEMVGVFTVLEGDEPKKSDYRKFKIESVQSSNDTAALSEVLERRLTHREWPLPQLIVVDGGNAQKNAFERLLKRKNVTIPVVGVVKDARHKPKQIIGVRSLIETHKNRILLANNESHRFAIAYHKKKRRLQT